jgi:chromosome partitioning protein
MRTVSVISQKGGAGKTTITVHLATAASRSGLTVAVIDLDPQATARRWGDKRGGAPEVVSDHAVRLPALLEAARANGADLVFVDTAPNADQAALGAAKGADLVLIPCRPSAFDLEAVEATLTLAEIARKPAYVVLNAAAPRSGLTAEAGAAMEAKGAKVAPVIIHQRAAFVNAVIDGRTAMELEPAGKAATEIAELWEWMNDQAR